MAPISASPREALASAWRNRHLIVILTRREIVGRYNGSALGVLWSLVLPVMMLAVYTFVFSTIFKARWNAESNSRTEFALTLFAGLMVFNLFAECVSKAPQLISQNQNYVKKVVFPLEILPWISLGASFFHLVISYSVWQLLYVVLFGIPPATALLFPLVLIPFVLFTMGLTWLLAALSVYLRDLVQVVSVMVTVLMFMSPIFYPVSALPASYRILIGLNPLAFPIEFARDVLLWGKVPDGGVFALYSLASLLVAYGGFFVFQKLRRGFADVV
ncbi:MAG: ABC transporter permease [Alphaproteobacteria bacterium]|nr:MAG: ABC transporter permease [Alphaproteobacteria bacterium]